MTNEQLLAVQSILASISYATSEQKASDEEAIAILDTIMDYCEVNAEILRDQRAERKGYGA